jgi:hypothetical protein
VVLGGVAVTAVWCAVCSDDWEHLVNHLQGLGGTLFVDEKFAASHVRSLRPCLGLSPSRVSVFDP